MIDDALSIAICSHIRPDGDAIGSLVALGLWLEGRNKKVVMLKNDDVPEYLKRLIPGTQEMRSPLSDEVFDLFITLDASSVDRIGRLESNFQQTASTISFDHHKTHTGFASLNIVEEQLSSTCELVYQFIHANHAPMDVEIATALFVGLITDSGRFLYENTTSNSHRMAADLLDIGVDHRTIYRELFQMQPFNAFMLNHKIVDQAIIDKDKGYVISFVTQELLDQYDVTLDELENTVNIFRDLEGIELSCFIKQEKDDTYKISLRSVEYVDVSAIAFDFEGGGHYYAAGFSMQEESLEDVIRILKERFDQIEWKS